jgi:hypothetical protein
MKRLQTIVTLGALVLLGGVASADTTYHFLWDFGEDNFFQFASGDHLAQSSPADSWDSDVDASGNLTFFDGATNFAHSTTHSLGGTVVVKAKFVIENVTGSVNLTAHTASWTFTGHVNFSATGLVSEGSCRTTSFTVSYSNNYLADHASSTFTIAALSGSGTQACGGNAAQLNSWFSLGSGGAFVTINKFNIAPL